MKAINMENVQASGDAERLVPGGYIAKITHVEDRAEKSYLYIEFDIAEGDFAGYYKGLQERAGFWGGRFMRSYKETALPMFKGFCNAINESNKGFVFDAGKVNADEQTLVDKYIGVVLGEEEYYGNDGNLKTRLIVRSTRSVQTIREGKFKTPDIKRVESTSAGGASGATGGFQNMPDEIAEELPF